MKMLLPFLSGMPLCILLFVLFSSSAVNPSETRLPNRSGKDFALFFASDTYDKSNSWRKLYAPVKDAYEMAADLHDLYGFDTAVVVNPTKAMVRETLARYAQKSFPDDGQLLVFFSGHGQYIDLLKDGFYIPKDGKSSKEDPYGDSWLKFTDLRRTISGINCRHILLCMDACYSGTLDEGVVFGKMKETDPEDFDRPKESEAKRKQRISDMLRPRTRLLIASGRKDYVPDPSEFAKQFKTALRSLGGADGLLDVHSIFHAYLKKAGSNPILSSFEQDEQASTFIFDYVNQKSSPAKESPPVVETPKPLPPSNDRDGDKFLNDEDECPDVPGEVKGCPDRDKDGIIDKNDSCPGEKGMAEFNGCPDSDKDGIPDNKDQCKYAPGSAATDGCPDLDGDGIPDHKDKCRRTVARKGRKNADGCPVYGFSANLGGSVNVFSYSSVGVILESTPINRMYYKIGLGFDPEIESTSYHAGLGYGWRLGAAHGLIANADAIFARNTSQITITSQGAYTTSRDKINSIYANVGYAFLPSNKRFHLRLNMALIGFDGEFKFGSAWGLYAGWRFWGVKD